MQVQPALFRRCVDEAVRAGPPLISSCIDDAVVALQEAERASMKAAERQELSDAWRELLRHKPEWVERYPHELRIALEAAPEPAATARAAGGMKIDSLTLVNDAQVDQQIESSRLSQLLQTAVTQPLGELDGLVSSLLGLPAVRPEQNPLRPDMFARVLQSVIAQGGPQAGQPALWTRHMAPRLGRELEQLYRRLSTLLTQANVPAATYRVLPARTGPQAAQAVALPAQPAQHAQQTQNAQPPFPAQSAAASTHTAHTAHSAAGAVPRLRTGSAWADLQSHAQGQALIHDFLFGDARGGDAPLPPAYYARVATDLARLEAAQDDHAGAFAAAEMQQYARLPVVDRPLRPVSTETTLRSELWGEYAASRQRSLVRTRLKQQARDASQVLGLEVVRKLVNQVAQDPRLLAPVRESIVALEPSLLRLAMVDPRFFTQEEHPGRRLVERVAERSFKYNDEFSNEFAEFSASVVASFNDLNALDEVAVRDAGPFESALAVLETAWTEQDALEESGRTAVLDAVRFAEQRQAEADVIAWEISQRPDLEGVPSVVQDFLYGSWALVTAHARLTRSTDPDPAACGQTLTDLLWSVKRDETLHEPARMIEMLPGLLQRLRSGLALLGQAPQESQAFFDALEKLHRPVLRLRAKKRRESSDFTPLEPEADDQPRPAARQQPRRGLSPWMGREELDVAGFQDTLPSNHAELAAEEVRVPAPAEWGPIDVDAMFAALREGCWVDLHSRGRWLRAQLVWASTKGTLFMFVSHGGQPHSMTRRSCERLLRDRQLRAVEMHGAVSHAIEVIAHAHPEAVTA